MADPISVASLGAVVRAHRKASGLSQKDLARAAGVSRATLNYLESGREDMEIGASKLLALLDVLGIAVAVSTEVERSADEAAVAAALAGLGKSADLKEGDLMEALASGRTPGAEDGIRAFLSGAPAGAGPAAVRLAAARSGNPPKEIARNGRSLAKALHVACPVWLGGG
ncbi:MAG: helix-turn-helix domain-containing protein [Candidatus Nanopelagicales bacterium]|jgi:transcriptional regulator with XRE-family HTH domain